MVSSSSSFDKSFSYELWTFEDVDTLLLLKCWDMITHWHGIISQKNYSAAKFMQETSKLTIGILFS